MKNEEIIANVALNEGIYTEEEITEYAKRGMEIPLHTLQGWRKRGMSVKKGEHGIPCRLWKMKELSDEESSADDSSRDFYQANAYLFRKEQVEPTRERREQYV